MPDFRKVGPHDTFINFTIMFLEQKLLQSRCCHSCPRFMFWCGLKLQCSYSTFALCKTNIPVGYSSVHNRGYSTERTLRIKFLILVALVSYHPITAYISFCYCSEVDEVDVWKPIAERLFWVCPTDVLVFPKMLFWSNSFWLSSHACNKNERKALNSNKSSISVNFCCIQEKHHDTFPNCHNLETEAVPMQNQLSSPRRLSHKWKFVVRSKSI